MSSKVINLEELKAVVYPSWIMKTLRKLRFERDKLSRKEKGSKNYKEQVERVKKLERKLFNQINYHLHSFMKEGNDEVFRFVYMLYQDIIDELYNEEYKGGDA